MSRSRKIKTNLNLPITYVKYHKKEVTNIWYIKLKFFKLFNKREVNNNSNVFQVESVYEIYFTKFIAENLQFALFNACWTF